MSYRLLLSAVALASLAAMPLYAQVKSDNKPDSSASVTMPNILPDASSVKPSSDPVSSKPAVAVPQIVVPPEIEKESQEIRQKDRLAELAAGGFKWVPWLDAGEKIWNFILERDPDGQYLTGDPKYRDVALYDIDKDSLPDVIVYDWTDCVAAGCPSVIYFSNKQYKPANFVAMEVKPYKSGVMADGNYVEF